MYVKETWCENMNGSYMAQDRDHWRTMVNMENESFGSIPQGNFLNKRVIIRLTRKILTHGGRS
jgi:hypothetical protein